MKMKRPAGPEKAPTNKKRKFDLLGMVRRGNVEHATEVLKTAPKEDVQEVIYRDDLLHLAVEKGDRAMAELLCKYAKNVDLMVDFETSTHRKYDCLFGLDQVNPLKIAVSRNDTEMAKILLDHGADIDGDENNYTPLTVAVACGHKPMTTFLLEQSANPNVPQHHCGYAPIHAAAERNNLGLMKLLVEAGADVNAVGNDATPLDMMMLKAKHAKRKSKRTDEIIAYLKRRGAKSYSDLF